MKNRIFFLDYTKAVGMLLIILAHTTYLFPAIDLHGIPESCHVPIFFLAVGLVHAYFPIGKGFVKKRFLGIMVPYIVFSIINSILKLGTLFATGKLGIDEIQDEMFALFINGNGPVWFLCTLFFADCMYGLLDKLKNKSIMVATCVVMLLIIYGIGDCNNRWIYPLIRIAGALALIIIGSFSKCLFDLHKSKRIIVCIILFTVWGLLLYSGNGQNEYSFRPGYFLNPLHSIPLFLSGSYSLMLLTTFIPDNVKSLEYIGKNSMGFLVIHPTLQMIYLFTIGGYIKSCSAAVQIPVFIVAYIVFLILCKPINDIILKLAPWSLGKIKK